MKILALVLFFFVTSPALAQWRPLETTEQSRQRHNAERWNTYKNRGYQAPLGGYQERLGDPAPSGTERPGYSDRLNPYGGYQSDYDRSRDSNSRQNSYGDTWRRR